MNLTLPVDGAKSEKRERVSKRERERERERESTLQRQKLKQSDDCLFKTKH